MIVHLTSDEMMQYLARACPSSDLLRMDDHLAACEDCRRRLDADGLVASNLAGVRNSLQLDTAAEWSNARLLQMKTTGAAIKDPYTRSARRGLTTVSAAPRRLVPRCVDSDQVCPRFPETGEIGTKFPEDARPNRQTSQPTHVEP